MPEQVRSTPDIAAVRAAAGRLEGVAHRTPVITSSRLDSDLGLRLFLKAEHLQRTGSFKFRGAYNALSTRVGPAGVVAFSSGNHAQAVALAARVLGVPATIVMPSDAPAIKLAATRGYGADIVLYERHTQDRAAIAAEISERTGAMLLPPFDHPDVIAGQGTAALELLDQVGPLDVVITPLGGGGLLAGTCLAVRATCPDAVIYGAEPAAGDDGKQSLDAGRIVRIDVPHTLADGAQTTALGELTFPVIRREVRDIVRVDDGELIDAMRSLAATCKAVVEPTGVLAYAAARSLRSELAGLRVGVILSGGNVDLARYAALIAD
ncbi:threo-3-hydroxy-L-aspartate ammonia-lyase [Allobranchiibius sp. GilTou38]|uniref:threo-3-hydroxy-L-aspartate ammonia-lyase n=1 Tax=Allobranchiibius sp. GilTou38 TaxID=2815210 RepID=UPI001AA11837|nr:threo-3-hydroxy-L-aspartate ammonia-lyase [Allobranchiibius sp. GilTou38]